MLRKENMRTYVKNAGGCVVTKSLMEGTSKLKWLFREKSVNPMDNGWRAMGDTDTKEYVQTKGNNIVVDFNTLANVDPCVLLVYGMPVGTELEVVYTRSCRYFIDANQGKRLYFMDQKPVAIGWTAQTHSKAFRINPRYMFAIIDDCLTKVEMDPEEFLTIEPEKPFHHVAFLQTTREMGGEGLHIEAGLDYKKENGALNVLAKDHLTVGEVLDLFMDYLRGAKLDLSDWYGMYTS